jgi:hypothetical protein
LACFGVLVACEGDPPEQPTRFLGQDPSVPASEGEARAGVIRDGVAGEAALFGGIGAEGLAGDIKLYNHQVQFVIQNTGRRHGWVDVGGTVIDADLVRPSGVPGRDALDDAFLGFGLSRLYEATSVEILADGSDGGSAVVRTTGGDVQWDFFARGLESDALLAGDQGLAIVRDYELAADSDSLRVVTTFTNAGETDVAIRPVEGFMTSREDFGTWSSGRGLVAPSWGEFDAVGYYGLRNEGVLSLWGEDVPISVFPGAALVAVASISVFDQGNLELAPGESETRVVRYTLAQDTATAEASRREIQGLAHGTVQGRTTDSGSGVGISGVRVHFVRDDGVVAGFALTGEDGAYAARLPAGDYAAWSTARSPQDRVQLAAGVGRFAHLGPESLNEPHLAALRGDTTPEAIPFAAGRWTPTPSPVSVVVGETVNLDLALPAAGELTLQIRDGNGTALPGIALIHHVGDEPPTSAVPDELREALGLPDRSLRLGWVWTASGSATIAAPPGDYSVDVGHSARHERSGPMAVTVPEGGTGQVEVVLAEVVARDGWFSVDPHLHAAPSMDGRAAMEDRLIACAAAGLDVPITTDHDRFADYGPLASAMGLNGRLLVIPGTEVTTLLRGHFNLFPVDVAAREVRNRGAVVWWDADPTTTDDLVGRVREAGTPDSLLQVNHGRLTLGMMDSAGYDATTGQPSRAGRWSWNFDQTEIVTAGSREEWIENRDDWFSFLSLGHGTVPVGASDSHDLHRACGLGRTDVFIEGATSIEDLDAGAVRDAIAAGRVVVASGVTLRATLDGALPGETVIGAPGEITVVVSGPSWIRPATLNVWRNGTVIHTQALGPSAPDGTVWAGTVPVEAEGDSWFAVEVDGGEPQGHAWGGHAPYAITNAFFVDTEGDGWTAPGL